MNLITNTPSIFPVNGAGKEGLTTVGKELALCCIADYACYLAEFFMQLSNLILQILYLVS